MRNHIIVEGMDGSGKDTLIGTLMKMTRGEFRIHERASTSLGGPVPNLADWVIKDLAEMPTNKPMIYNRHPLISELIYAPRRRVNPGLRGKWQMSAWVHTNRLIAAQHCILVICQPPFHTIHANLKRSGSEAHMPGVMEHAGILYAEYEHFGFPLWHGSLLRYDYRHETPQHFLFRLREEQARKVA